MYWCGLRIDPGIRLEERYLSVRVQYTNGEIRHFLGKTLADALKESNRVLGWKPIRITAEYVLTQHPDPPSPREIFNAKYQWNHPKDLVDYLEDAQ